MASSLCRQKRSRRLSAVSGVLLFLVLVLQTAWRYVPELAHAGVTEPKSGAVFPQELGDQALVAVDARIKFGFLKVYAVGFYMDKSCRLWGLTGVNAEQLIYALKGYGKSSLRMVITSSFASTAMLVGKLREKVEPLLALDAQERTRVMRNFEGAFKAGPELQTGMVILLAFTPYGIRVTVDTHSSEVGSPELAVALLQTYLSPAHGVLPEFPQAVMQGIEAGMIGGEVPCE
eukprot:TRINITY_DN18736_c0_g2_i1.p1 TRINITY_DN18736_c0_g2~~TRINITY_DN18736_c0_g2_i1.p1  ORF type:complete len:232 (-),score=41.00 TRINITY_DN18736_c0_g2_i1:455-1150(-)